MAHTLLHIGYKTYVLPMEEAIRVASALADAPVYERKGYGETATMHCYKQESSQRQITIEVITDDDLALAKLAGKPSKQDAA